jgi:signal transduction histidine kinase
LRTAPVRIDEALAPSHPRAERAGRVANALRRLWPFSPLYACLLWEGGRPRACVLDGSGSPRPDWAEAFREELAGPGRTPPAPGPTTHRLLGHPLALAEVPSPGSRPGALAVAVKEGLPSEAGLRVHAVLAVCAHRLAFGLAREAAEEERRARAARLTELAGLADLGELAGPVAHEFNNFLNVLILHLAVLEQELPESLRPELAEINRQGKGMAAVIQNWQRYRRNRRGVSGPSDLNGAVRAAVAGLARRAAADAAPQDGAEGATAPAAPEGVSVELHPDPLPVPAAAHDLERLCTFLVGNAAAAAGTGRVLVRTGPDAKGARLRVEDSGPTIATESLSEIFDLGGVRREGTDSLELAACRSLVRRLQGSIRAENRPEGGLAVTVVLPAATALDLPQ